VTDAQERHEPDAPRQDLPGPAESGATSVAATLVEKLAERLGARASVANVFGEPVTAGDVTVIPVAKVLLGLGGGGGRERAAAKAGEGLGTGGGVHARPVGYIEIRDGQTQFVPIHDQRADTFYGMAAVIAALSVSRIIRSLTRRRRA
jgi:uncharacterized spore protein YtfJ